MIEAFVNWLRSVQVPFDTKALADHLVQKRQVIVQDAAALKMCAEAWNKQTTLPPGSRILAVHAEAKVTVSILVDVKEAKLETFLRRSIGYEPMFMMFQFYLKPDGQINLVEYIGLLGNAVGLGHYDQRGMQFIRINGERVVRSISRELDKSTESFGLWKFLALAGADQRHIVGYSLCGPGPHMILAKFLFGENNAVH